MSDKYLLNSELENGQEIFKNNELASVTTNILISVCLNHRILGESGKQKCVNECQTFDLDTLID